MDGLLDKLAEAGTDATLIAAANLKISELTKEVEDVSSLNSENNADSPTIVEKPAACTSDTSCEYICNSFVGFSGVADDGMKMADSLTKNANDKPIDDTRKVNVAGVVNTLTEEGVNVKDARRRLATTTAKVEFSSDSSKTFTPDSDDQTDGYDTTTFVENPLDEQNAALGITDDSYNLPAESTSANG